MFSLIIQGGFYNLYFPSYAIQISNNTNQRYNIKNNKQFMRESHSSNSTSSDQRNHYGSRRMPASNDDHISNLPEDATIEMGMCRHCKQQYPIISLIDHDQVCTSRPKKCYTCLQNVYAQDHDLKCEALKQQPIEKSFKNIVKIVSSKWEDLLTKVTENYDQYKNIFRAEVRDRKQQFNNQLKFWPRLFKGNLCQEDYQKKLANLNEACSICLQNYNSGQKVSFYKCNHQYHSECIHSWQNSMKISCPICRAELEKLHSGIVETKRNETKLE